MTKPPLILTLMLNEAATVFFTHLRDMYFPPERNFLKAHLTLFHKLPPEEELVIEALIQISGNQNEIALEVAGLLNMGNGVAFKVTSGELQNMQKLLQQKWHGFTSPQDKQKLNPHITIQNKVTPAVARQLHVKLEETFSPFIITGKGLQLWEYHGGPWGLYRTFPFQKQAMV